MNLKNIFFIVFLLLSIGFSFFLPKDALALTCSGCSIEPSNPSLSTSITMFGNGCDFQSNLPSFSIFNVDTQQSVFAGPLTPNNGSFSQPLPSLGAAGNYTIIISDGGFGSASCASFSITEDEEETLKCGDVTATKSDLCPAECPSELMTASQWFCACGRDGQICCPEGNSGGRPACSVGVCISGKCGAAPSGPGADLLSPCADSAYGLQTAVGCVPIDLVKNTTSFLITWGIAISGGVFILTTIAAGITIITSKGDPAKLASGKEMIMSSLSGVLMIIFAIFLLRVIGVNVLGLF